MGRESFDDTELGGENLSAAVVDDCPHVCTNHPYTGDESCGIKDEAYLSCTLIISMGQEGGREGWGPALPLLLPADCGETAAVCSICAAVWTCQPAAAYGNGSAGNAVAIAEEGEEAGSRIAAPLFYDAGRSRTRRWIQNNSRGGRMNAG